MNDWTVRTRISPAFATVITIMAALAAVFVELGNRQKQAILLRSDVPPGLLQSTQARAHDRALRPAVLTPAMARDGQERARAH